MRRRIYSKWRDSCRRRVICVWRVMMDRRSKVCVFISCSSLNVFHLTFICADNDDKHVASIPTPQYNNTIIMELLLGERDDKQQELCVGLQRDLQRLLLAWCMRREFVHVCFRFYCFLL
jgi:hypothetical protein